MEKSIVFVDRKCPACNGEDCEACDGTGSVGSIDERDAPELRPDYLSKALCKWREKHGIGFKALGEDIGVSVARASELCRGAGEVRTNEEAFSILQIVSGDVIEASEAIAFHLLLIGDGDIEKGLELVKAVAQRLAHARSKHKWPDESDGKFQALGVIHAEYRELEQAVEHGEGREREKDEALDVITTAARFWLGEHERQR